MRALPTPAPLLALALTLALAACAPPAPRPLSGEAAGEPPAGVAPATAVPVVADAADWCAGHAVPESACTLCNPELVERFRAAGDWCAAHALPESVCPACGHGLEPPGGAAARDWCGEHGLPESRCTICNPGLIESFRAIGDWCAEHGLPESSCPLCGNAVDRPSVAGVRIRFRDEERERAAGIELVAAGAGGVARVIEAPCRVDHDRNRLARVSAPIEGVVREVLVDLGDTVSAGTPLFVVESLSLAEARRSADSARRAVELARSQVERQRLLQERGIGSQAAVERARRELQAEERQVAALDAQLELAGPPAGGAARYALRAPVGGTVVERAAVRGARAAPGEELALLADLTRAWAWADVRAELATGLEEELPAEVVVPGLEHAPARGSVTWVSPVVDERTRTVAVRIEIEEGAGRLRANQFGRARIGVTAGGAGTVVPVDALQRVGDETVVFVKTAPQTYEPRVVRVAGRLEDELEVDGPVSPGDPVVTIGAFLLKTELRRDSIGAGCCEVESLGGD